jgi:FkbM family methyltransferase
VTITFRDIGIHMIRAMPFLESTARSIYLRLPRHWHDTPTYWLESLLGQEADITFIQIGAFDGVAGDPLRPLILAHPSWRGALVEPMPGSFAQLRDNYGVAPGPLHFLNCAVSDQSGTITMYFIGEDEIARLGLPNWSREVASVIESHIEKHFPNARISARAVPAMKISEIAQTCDFTKVDLIVMDVEGHERRIIDSLDFTALGVRAAVFEHKHMIESEYDAVRGRLASFGFRLKRYGRDTVAYR